MKVNNIPYIGLDFILKKDGVPVLLEINDHPTNSTLEGFNSNASYIVELIKLACDNKTNKLICFLLPDCFSIKPEKQIAKFIDISSHLDTSMLSTVIEFNQLGEILNSIGIDHYICDISAIEIQDKFCVVNGKRIDVLYRRSNYFPPIKTKTICINDIRARGLCLDKKRCVDILKTMIDPSNLPKEVDGNTKYVIRKPRFGSASRNIERKGIIEADKLGWLNASDEWIVQEWIEPQYLHIQDKQYYFDLRVFVINGIAKSIFIRSSAFPLSFEGNSWLTTTGKIISVYPQSNFDKNFELSETFYTSLPEIISLSEKIVKLINTYIENLDTSSEIENIPSLEEIWNFSGKLKTIYLTSKEK